MKNSNIYYFITIKISKRHTPDTMKSKLQNNKITNIMMHLCNIGSVIKNKLETSWRLIYRYLTQFHKIFKSFSWKI